MLNYDPKDIMITMNVMRKEMAKIILEITKSESGLKNIKNQLKSFSV